MRNRSMSFALVVSAMVTVARQGSAQQTESPEALARRVLQTTPLIDGHNDLPWTIREFTAAPADVEAYDLRGAVPGMTDVRRLRAGMLGGQFWSVYVPGEIRDSGYARVELEQLDIARRVIAKYPDVFQWALTADGMRRAFASGRIGSVLGLEGGHAIENSLGALRMYFDLGVRYMTLTHNVTLDWADAASDTARHDGLTRFGQEVVREMNRLGMLVDLSHVSPATMHDALDVSEAPVIFSHSSARALLDHVRNVPDDVLRRLPQNGGVVMVTFVPSFISPNVRDGSSARAEIREVADHIEHIRRVAGVDHVGIGSDFDGITQTVRGLEDVSTFPALFTALARRGWSESDLRKLAGENILRVMSRAETVAMRLRRERPPSVKTIRELDGPTAVP